MGIPELLFEALACKLQISHVITRVGYSVLCSCGVLGKAETLSYILTVMGSQNSVAVFE